MPPRIPGTTGARRSATCATATPMLVLAAVAAAATVVRVPLL